MLEYGFQNGPRGSQIPLWTPQTEKKVSLGFSQTQKTASRRKDGRKIILRGKPRGTTARRKKESKAKSTWEKKAKNGKANVAGFSTK